MFDWLKKRRPAAGPAAAAPRPTSPPGGGASAPGAAGSAGAAAPTSESKRLEGNAFLGQGNLAAAAGSYAEAARLDEQSVAARVNLAFVLIELKRSAEAEGHLQRALAIDAGNVDAAYMLGNLARERKDLDGALALFERVFVAKPDFELAWRDACLACVESGQLERLQSLLQRGLQALPGSAELQFLRGNALQVAGRSEEAIAAYERVLAARRDHVEAHSNIAVSLRALGRLHDAVPHLQRVAALRPEDGGAQMQFGGALLQLGHVDAAIAALRRATAADPNSASAASLLGSAYGVQRRAAEAIAEYQRALTIDATHAFAYAGLGVEFNEQGRPLEAMASLRKAIELDPGAAEAHSSLLFLMSFQSTPAEYLEEARRYGAKVAARAKPLSLNATVPAAGEAVPTPLRVGVVSGDLRAHPVALFLEGAISQLDRRKVELFAYSTTPKEDEVTARLKPFFTGWRSLVGLGDEEAARRIQADGIHVLIDVAGHTADNRLSMFPWRPAPVQATWLGYLASTGLEAMDYVIADRASLPQEAQGHFVERVWHLPNSLYCYTAPADAPPVGPLPAARNGAVTFGTFQRMNKVSDGTLRAWAEILRRMPAARLRVQNKQMSDARERSRLLQRLDALGIASDRVVLGGQVPDRNAYLACHGEVDIVLDTFPYPGITTTCEALWMGVPTVTLAGTTLLSRQGASLLHCVGLGDWVAADEEDFVARALDRAADLEGLARLRAGLRERAAASPLFDAPRFARDLEAALAGMWRERRGSGADAPGASPEPAEAPAPATPAA